MRYVDPTGHDLDDITKDCYCGGGGGGGRAISLTAALITAALQKFSRAADFGIRTYTQLRQAIVNTGLQAHHLIEKRFANILGVNQGDIPSIALTPAEHQIFTNRWLAEIGRMTMNSPIRTDNATRLDIWTAAQRVYSDHPVLLEVIKQYLGIP